jgi:hypothetical protein
LKKSPPVFVNSRLAPLCDPIVFFVLIDPFDPSPPATTYNAASLATLKAKTRLHPFFENSKTGN